MAFKFFDIKNQTNSAADIYFYGDIVSETWDKWTDEEKCPQDIIDILKGLDDVEELNIYINSGGGSVWAGIAIYNILKRHSAKKTVHIDGLAASISSVIALAGDEIIMPSNSFMMIHKALCSAWGNSAQLREIADRLDNIEQSIVNVYMENSTDGTQEDAIKDMMAAETWLCAAEAAKIFKNIRVTEAMEAAACVSDYRYKNAPEGIFNKKPLREKNVNNAERLECLNNFIFMEECENE